MKKQSFKLFALALVLGLFTVLGTASSANAQSLLRLNIPFEFHVGSEKYAAGKYEIKKINSSVYLLRNADVGKAFLIGTDNDVSQNKNVKSESIVFNRYGETYFLREIFSHRAYGRQISESKLEKKIRNQESNLAENDSKKEQISISSTR
jgi:hypothetical protein